MHHALQIPEILLKIFGDCVIYTSWGSRTNRYDLAALARTCRAFKEPALDVLWEELEDPSPLAQCLPEASYFRKTATCEKFYSFSRPLTQIEWAILRDYTRRILLLQNEWSGSLELDWESVKTFLDHPTIDPLFPNLRHLVCGYAGGITYLLSMPFPSLISFSVRYSDLKNHALWGTLESFSQISPNIKNLNICTLGFDITSGKSSFSGICRWRNLHTVYCPRVALDVDTLAHLSRMPTLTQLAFMLSNTSPGRIAPPDSPLYFTNLHELALHSDSLHPISQLLFWTRLPTITNIGCVIRRRPSKLDASAFFSSVQTSNPGYTIQYLWLYQLASCSDGAGMDDTEDVKFVLGWEYLQPCMRFSDLRSLSLDMECDVALTDSKLLALVSAWPCLEHLEVNDKWGWNTTGGITPNGLLQLLQTCRSLHYLALAINTRGYTRLHESPESFGLTIPVDFEVDIVDSRIEAESVPAIASFFAALRPGCIRVVDGPCIWFRRKKVYEDRWNDVSERIT